MSDAAGLFDAVVSPCLAVLGLVLICLPAASADGFVEVPEGFDVIDVTVPGNGTHDLLEVYGVQVVVVTAGPGLIAVHVDDDGNATNGTSVVLGWSHEPSADVSALASSSALEDVHGDLSTRVLLAEKRAHNASIEATKAAQRALDARDAAVEAGDHSSVLAGTDDVRRAVEAQEDDGALLVLVVVAIVLSAVNLAATAYDRFISPRGDSMHSTATPASTGSSGATTPVTPEAEAETFTWADTDPEDE